MSRLRRSAAVLAVTCLVGVGVGTAPALAAPVGDFATLAAAFADPSAVGEEVQLDGDVVQGAAPDLTLAPGSDLSLDLDGHDLTTASIVLGAGSTLTLTDTSAGVPGTLSATGTGPDRRPAIESTDATLIIEGRAVVVARGVYNTTAGIGGGDLGDGGTIVIRGDADVTATGGQFGAGIGSGDGSSAVTRSAGSITIGGNARVTAIGNDGAGIGGGDYTDGGSITITDDARVSASSRIGAGIGGGYWGGSGGTVRIDGNATVEATSTERGAGIGGGTASLDGPAPRGGNGGTVTIAGSATVTATAGAWGAGIGGGQRGAGGTLTVTDDATVTATATGAGAGIGGGQGGSGGTVVLRGGTTTAVNAAGSSSSAVGFGQGATTFGSLAVRAPATLVIPDPAVLRVPVGATVTGDGELRGGPVSGTVVNEGAIQLPADGVDWPTLGLYPNNYLVTFDANGGSGTSAVRVFATSFVAGARVVPAAPQWAGFELLGWNSVREHTGASLVVTSDTALSGDLTLFAQWVANTVTTAVLGGTPGIGQPTPVAVTVTAANPVAGVPVGAVQLVVDGVPVGPQVAVDALGTATLTLPGATTQTRALRAEFIPTSSLWRDSVSPELPIDIRAVPEPTPTPTPTPSPTPAPEPGVAAPSGPLDASDPAGPSAPADGLAATGSSFGPLLAVLVAALVAAGAVVLMAVRRREQTGR